MIKPRSARGEKAYQKLPVEIDNRRQPERKLPQAAYMNGRKSNRKGDAEGDTFLPAPKKSRDDPLLTQTTRRRSGDQGQHLSTLNYPSFSGRLQEGTKRGLFCRRFYSRWKGMGG